MRHHHHRSGTSGAEPMATEKGLREEGAGEMLTLNKTSLLATWQVQKVEKRDRTNENRY